MRTWLKNVYTMKIKGHTVAENHFLREHTPLTLFTLLTLLKQLTLFDFTQYMNRLFHFDCLGRQELENIAYDGRACFVCLAGWMGLIIQLDCYDN